MLDSAVLRSRPLQRAFECHGGLDFPKSLCFCNSFETRLNAPTKVIETLLHATNTLEQAGIDQRGYGLAILVDDDAVVAILDLIEHFAQVLSEGDGACLGNHHVTPVLIIMVIMVLLAYGVNLT